MEDKINEITKLLQENGYMVVIKKITEEMINHCDICEAHGLMKCEDCSCNICGFYESNRFR